MGGAQPLAVTSNGGVGAVHRGRPGAGAAAARPRLPRRDRRLARRRHRPGRGGQAASGGRCRSPWSRNCRRRAARAGAPRLDARRRHRPDLGPRRAQRLRAGRDVARRGARAARGPSPRSTSTGRRASMAEHCRAMVDLQRGRRGRLRLRQRPARPGAGRRRSPTRSPTRASCRPTSGRCSPAAPGRSAGPACPATRPTSRRTDEAVLERFPDDDGLQRWIAVRRRAGARARACRRGSAGSATASGTWPARRSTTWSRRGAVSRADRHRPRPPRRRLGRLAGARDRGDARRHRRDRRLADPQRAAQHRVRRVLGVGAPRRRGRHRQVDPRRHGGRRRRHRRRRASG